MSSAPQDKLYLYDTSTGERFAEVDHDGLDIYFPEDVHGWSDVLDCRPEPYADQSIEDNCHFAEHVHKKFILVSEAQIARQTPPSSE